MNHAAQKMVETFLFCCFDRDVGQYRYLKKKSMGLVNYKSFFSQITRGA